MRRFTARATAFTLAFVMAATPLAAASQALGHDLSATATRLSRDAVLEQQVFWSDTYSDLRAEHTVTWRPGGTVEPVVSFGGKVLAKATLDAMARELEAQGRRVISGINGDYYVMATGQPLGLVVSGGEVKSSDGVGEDAHYAVGFRADGSAFIGAKPNLRTTLNTGSAVFTLAGVNKVRSETGAPVLLTDEFHTGTANTSAGINVVLAPVAGQSGVFSTRRDEQEVVLARSERLTVNGRVTCTVESVTEESASTPIPEGKFVLTMNAKGDPARYEALRSLAPGQTVDIDITAADPIWTEAVSATGALYKLVEGEPRSPDCPPSRPPAPPSASRATAPWSSIPSTANSRVTAWAPP